MTHLLTHLAGRADRATFRVGEADGPCSVVKVSTAYDGFADEVRARAALSASGFPVAVPLSYVQGPPALLTLPWVEGRALDPTCPVASLHQAGRLLARVHGMPATGAFAGNDTWSGWMAGWLSHATGWWRSAAPDEPGLLATMGETLADLAPAMDRASGSTILFDAPPAHFLCLPDGDVAMIDVEGMRVGDPAMDLAVLEVWDSEIMGAVLSGYMAERPLGDLSFDRRRSFYLVLRALAAAEWHGTALEDPLRQEHFMGVVRRGVAQMGLTPRQTS